MKYSIGCSGYYYPQWKNKLYPKGLATKNWLAYYSTIFNTVELNGTFYRTPKLPDLKKYAAVTIEGFTFSVKMNRYITHIERLKNKEAIQDFQDLLIEGLGNKLQHFLFQLPPSFHYSVENLEKIITNIPHNAQNVIEFRHISWWNETVATALRQAKLTFCNVDFPGLDTWFIQTTPHFYLRLHGNPELFKTPYSESQLRSWYAKFPKAKTASIYFNNTITEAGYENALTLMKITSE